MNAAVLLLKILFVFIATEIDDFIVFVILYSKNSEKGNKLAIFMAQFFVLAAVTVACGFVASFLSRIPEKYIRFVGFLPFLIGVYELIKFLIKKFKNRRTELKNPEQDEDVKDTTGIKNFKLFVVSASVVIAASGDNLGIYILFFVNMNFMFKIITLAGFLVLQGIWSFLQIKAAQIKPIQKVVKKTGAILEPVVFMILGILILAGI